MFLLFSSTLPLETPPLPSITAHLHDHANQLFRLKDAETLETFGNGVVINCENSSKLTRVLVAQGTEVKFIWGENPSKHHVHIQSYVEKENNCCLNWCGWCKFWNHCCGSSPYLGGVSTNRESVTWLTDGSMLIREMPNAHTAIHADAPSNPLTLSTLTDMR